MNGTVKQIWIYYMWKQNYIGLKKVRSVKLRTRRRRQWVDLLVLSLYVCVVKRVLHHTHVCGAAMRIILLHVG